MHTLHFEKNIGDAKDQRSCRRRDDKSCVACRRRTAQRNNVVLLKRPGHQGGGLWHQADGPSDRKQEKDNVQRVCPRVMPVIVLQHCQYGKEDAHMHRA